MKLFERFNELIDSSQIAMQWLRKSSFAFKDISGNVLVVNLYFPTHRPAAEFLHRARPIAEELSFYHSVLVTHNHRGHNCIESQLEIFSSKDKVGLVADESSCKAMIRQEVAASRIRKIKAGERLGLWRDGWVATVDSKPIVAAVGSGKQRQETEHLGYLIYFNEKVLYLSGDPASDFSARPELVDPVRLFSVVFGCLTSHPDEGEFSYFEGSAEIAVAIGLKVAIPAHYDCFRALSYDASIWENFVERREDATPVSTHTVVVHCSIIFVRFHRNYLIYYE